LDKFPPLAPFVNLLRVRILDSEEFNNQIKALIGNLIFDQIRLIRKLWPKRFHQIDPRREKEENDLTFIRQIPTSQDLRQTG
jgi:hypothetical protein